VCEARQAFRNFRIDRIESLKLFNTHFKDEAGKTLVDLLRLVQTENKSFTL
jgi:predicted DNA-binding transcriptional regulator YafY